MRLLAFTCCYSKGTSTCYDNCKQKSAWLVTGDKKGIFACDMYSYLIAKNQYLNP